MSSPAHNYTEDSIKSLDWREHIRLRPGMYIGKLGDGSQPEDGLYVLLKEVIDNCIDEHAIGFGNTVAINIAEDQTVTVRDYGRGVPLGKLMECSAQINTGAKYDSEVFKRSVGLNGVGESGDFWAVWAGFAEEGSGAGLAFAGLGGEGLEGQLAELGLEFGGKHGGGESGCQRDDPPRGGRAC